MSNESKPEGPQESTFIGEVSNPLSLPELPTRIEFSMRSLQKGTLLYGAAQMTTRSGIVYPVVIRTILRSQSGSLSGKEVAEEQRVTVEGISFTQATQMHRLIQKQTPKILAFIGEARNPFSSDTITRGFMGFHVHPVQQNDLLQPDGVLRPYGTVHLVSSSGNVYPVTIRGSGRPHFDRAKHDYTWDQEIAVDGITLDQAQNIYSMTQNVGPEGTTAIGIILQANRSSDRSGNFDLHVRMLQCGLMRKEGGTAQLVSTSGEAYPVLIREIHAVSSPDTSLLEERRSMYIMSVDGITLSQAQKVQTLVQEPKALDNR